MVARLSGEIRDRQVDLFGPLRSLPIQRLRLLRCWGSDGGETRRERTSERPGNLSALLLQPEVLGWSLQREGQRRSCRDDDRLPCSSDDTLKAADGRALALIIAGSGG